MRYLDSGAAEAREASGVFEDCEEALPLVLSVVEVIVVSTAEGNAVGQDSSEVGALTARLDVVRVEVRLRATVWDLAGVVVAAEHSSFPITVCCALVVIIHSFLSVRCSEGVDSPDGRLVRSAMRRGRPAGRVAGRKAAKSRRNESHVVTATRRAL